MFEVFVSPNPSSFVSTDTSTGGGKNLSKTLGVLSSGGFTADRGDPEPPGLGELATTGAITGITNGNIKDDVGMALEVEPGT